MQKIFLLIFIVSLYMSVNAQSGRPDSTFGKNGYIGTTVPGSVHSYPQVVKDCILYPDGKMALVIGDGVKTVISKRLGNGSPDITYGKNSFSVIVSLIVTATAVQPDGKIVVAGTSNGNDNFMLARYNTDGTLDETFGNAGIIILDLGSRPSFLSAIVITQDNKIITAGSSRINGIDQFTLAYFTPGGLPDNSFGNNGIITTDFDGLGSSISDLRLQSDGKHIAAGTVGNGSLVDFALARYNVDGSPDLSFHSTGRTSSDFDPTDRATSVIVDNTGKIYTGGISYDLSGYRHFRIARYNADGDLDLTYNAGAGSVTATFGGSDEILTNIRFLEDGSIIAAGQANINPANYDVALTHVNIDGTIDRSFGSNGLLLADYNTRTDESDFLLIQPDGKILTGGMSGDFNLLSDSWFSCFRFNQDGSPDVSFGNNGTLVDFLPTSYYIYYSSMFVQPDGKLLAMSESFDETSAKMFINRFNADGTPDETYAPNGSKELNYEAGSSFFQPDGKLMRAGYSQTNNGDILLLRYNTDGTPDAGFGTGGRVTSDFGGMESTGPIAFQADGKIIVGGFSRNSNGTDWLIVRYNANGSIDGSFGTNGYVRMDNAIEENIQAISITADGKIILSGTSFNYPPDFSYVHFDVLTARLNADGSIDAGFGNQGLVITDRSDDDFFGAQAVQDDGKIVFSYYANSGPSPQQAFLEQLNPDGSHNADFGEGGKISCDGAVLTLLPDQKILISGNRANNRNNIDFSLSQFTREGKPDISFGKNGSTTISFTGMDNYLYNNLLAGNALFCSGNGVDQSGLKSGLVAKFLVKSADLVCPANQVVPTDKNACSAKVYNIDPSVSCTSGSTINYTLAGATTGTGTCTASGINFNKGVTTVTYTPGTDAGRSCSFTVTVLDKEIPAIENLSTSLSTLWPADHRMKDITVNYSLNDNCGIKNTRLTVSSNEPVAGSGGFQWPDWKIIDDHHIRLRAERLQTGNGRIYTIRVTTTDFSGNRNSKSTLVTVPKNAGPDCRLDIDIAPNPTHNYFLVTVRSNCDDAINMRIFNCTGNLIGNISGLHAPSVTKIGEGFLPGIYYLKVIQSGIVKQLN